MKSVKNFFIERINSFEHSDSSSGGGGGSGKKHHRLEKLKYASGTGSGGSSASTNDPATPTAASAADAGSATASSPSVISNLAAGAVGDTSPSISLTAQTPGAVDARLTPAGDSANARSPTHCANNNNSRSPTDEVTPFDFTPGSRGHVYAPTSGSAGTHVSGSMSAPAIKAQKSRRKISLPWFRQSSVSTAHVGLSRQHTIDSPASFRLFRHSSNHFKVSTQEATWVVSDYIATAGSNELSVTKGQQVEVVEAPTATEPDFCLVRLNPQTDDAAVQEGLVPVSILKPPPGSQKNSSSRKDNNDAAQEQSNNRGKPDPLTSSTKRRGFSGRKWLPQPLRKRSQSKVEKPPAEKSLIKKTSEKSLRLPQKHEDENATSSSTLHTSASSYNQAASAAAAAHNTSQQDYEAEEEAGLELPPPMKPIQEPHLIAANGPPSAFNKDAKENSTILASGGKMDGKAAIDLSEIEQIVKEKTEQHEEKSKFLKPSFDNSIVESNGRTVSFGSSSGEYDLRYSTNSTDSSDKNNAECNDTEAALSKRMSALKELLDTEQSYIEALSCVVNGYMAEVSNLNSDIPLPEDLRGGKDRMVFCNIEFIYEWHRDYFLKALQRCKDNPAELGTIIKRYEPKFRMYFVYCQNKPVSEHIVNEHFLYFDQVRQKVEQQKQISEQTESKGNDIKSGPSLHLSDLLIAPVQRLTKYELLFREIIKQTERAGLVKEVASMKESLHVMKDICKAVNDMMVLRRLQKFEGKITAQGKLLLHGILTCIEDVKNADRNAGIVQKPRELQVFLLQQSIIFADIVGKKTQFTIPTFIYRSHLQINKMQLEELSNNRFLLKSIDPKRPDFNMICYAATADANREWLETIRNILKSQNDFLKAITSPIEHQKKEQTSKQQQDD